MDNFVRFRYSVRNGISASLLLATLVAGGCHDNNDNDDMAPSVTLTAPPDPASRTVTLTATAMDDNAVTQVDFLVDGASIGSDSEAPYTAEWNTSTVGDGTHTVRAQARDAEGNTGNSTELTVTVDNVRDYAVQLAGIQEVPPVDTDASGTGQFTINVGTGETSGNLQVQGMTATAAHIHDGFAGTAGDILIGLTASAPNAFAVPAGSLLTAEQVDRLLAGGLYVNAHSAAYPGGEIRAQLVMAPIEVQHTVLNGQQEVPPVTTDASGVAATTVNLNSGALTVHVNTVNIDDATEAHVHRGEVGVAGPVLIPLQKDALNPAHWSVAGATLDAAGLDDYKNKRLYVNVHTPDNPGGEIRGQIGLPPPNPTDTTPPTVTLDSPGANVSATVTLNATAQDETAIAEVRFLVGTNVIGTDTTAPYSVDWNTTGVANGTVALTAEARDTAGNVTTSAPVTVNVSNAAPTAVTLTQLQSSVFTPRCSSCHNGTGTSLPGVLNLSSASTSHANLVNVASLEVPTLQRVAPGNPDNSYLIHKIEGTQEQGSRMPLGGPYLDQPTIDQVRQWISAGALND